MDYVRPLTNMLDVCLTLDPSFSTLEDLAFLDAAQSVYLLGTVFSPKDVEAIKAFSRSLIWLTYRKSWPAPIGGFGGPTSDRGWGCMIRCGQMLLAQTISTIHLGPSWRWNSNNDKDNQLSEEQQKPEFLVYQRLLRLFQDKRTALFSIHQIAQFGVSEGKQLGEWLGPNTMAQVLKKLVVYDEWTRLVVHVAMDNVLISDDVHIMASQPVKNDQNGGGNVSKETEDERCWTRPLLLIVPLRLGLTAINPCYLNAIVEYFKLPQCVGILGGRPNHAVYFYGAAGKKLLYLDPHICQEFRDLDTPSPSYVGDDEAEQLERDEILAVHQQQTHHAGGSSNCSDPPEVVQALRSVTISPPSGGGGREEDEVLLPPTSSSSSSSSDRQNNEAAISFPTSSSISKISSATTSEPDECCGPLPLPSSMVMDASLLASFSSGTIIDVHRSHPHDHPAENDEDDITDGMTPKKDDLLRHSDLIEGDEVTLKKKDGQHNNNDTMPAQETQDSKASNSAEAINNAAFDDSSFHCPYLQTMDFKSLDPSLALGFLARTRDEYEDLVHRLKTSVLPSSTPPLFEILDVRPRGWPRFTPFETAYDDDEGLNIKEYDDLKYDSDEQFELLE